MDAPDTPPQPSEPVSQGTASGEVAPTQESTVTPVAASPDASAAEPGTPQPGVPPLILGGLIAVALLLAWPASLMVPKMGHWEVGMIGAQLGHLQFGRDVLFNYGPLGYLVCPIYLDRGLWLNTQIYTIFAECLLGLAWFGWLRSQRATLPLVLLNVIVYVMVYQDSWLHEYHLPLALLLMVWTNVIRRTPPTAWHMVAVGLAMLTLYIKFSLGLVSIGILIGYAGWSLTQKWYGRAALLGFAAILGVGLGSVWLIGDMGATIDFMRGSWRITSVYGSAMQRVAPFGEARLLALSIASWFLLAASIGLAWWRGPRPLATLLILSGAVFFVTWKHGIVRADYEHLGAFHGLWTFLLVSLLVTVLPWRLRIGIPSRVAYLVLVGMLLLVTWRIMGGTPLSFVSSTLAERQQALLNAVLLVLRPEQGEDLVEYYVHEYQASARWSNAMIKATQGKRVEALMCDNAMIPSFGCIWAPRPIFQSYGVGAPELDDLNDAYLRGPNRPDFAVFSLHTIDYRYPLFDEPRTYRNLLHNYRFVLRSDINILVERTDTALDVPMTPLARTTGHMDDVFPVPPSSDLVYARIHLPRSTRGRMQDFLYKIEPVYIHFIDQNGGNTTFRIVPGLAKNGLLVSDQVRDIADLAALWQGERVSPIVGFALSTPQPGCYAASFEIEFLSMPRPTVAPAAAPQSQRQ